MAIETRKALARDFLPLLKAKIAAFFLLTEIILMVGLAALLFFTNVFTSDPLLSAIVIAISVAVTALAYWIGYNLVMRPLKDVTAAIVHISGEPTTTTPPNPNDERYAKSGLRDILQTLYQLDAASTAKPLQPAPAETGLGPVQIALNKTVCGFVVMNHQRAITYANKNAATSVDNTGATQLELLFPDTDSLTAWLDDCDKNAVHAERTWVRIPDRLPDQEGRRFFDVFASYDKGSDSETVITMIDRTNLYEVGEQELDFIAFAAHELRGPITVIRGYIDVLEDELHDKLQDDQEELFSRLRVSANRLSGYINNILNTSRYDRRHLQLHLVETSLSSVYAMIADDMQLRASSQDRLLSVTIPNTLPTIAADSASLSEVIGNLIDNAIKYSNEGGAINVTASQKGDMVEFSVEDHGIGMPGNVVSNLFQKFYRSHRSRETVAGTGIGLYISKAIIESHGGTISVRSEDGHSSTFTVSLPTYVSVADKLKAGNNSNQGLISEGQGWIKNHDMYRG